MSIQPSAVTFQSGPAVAKTPGARYCFRRICHRVKTIAETRAAVGRTFVVKASYYRDARVDRFNPSNITSSGEYFRADRPDNAASPIFPDGTTLLVWHPGTRKAVIVRVNNAGPYYGRRTLDLSKAAAAKLGYLHSGVATVHLRVLRAPTPAEARYRRGRRYAPVPGFIGAYGSVNLAWASANEAIFGRGGGSVQIASGPPPPVPVAKTVAMAGAPAVVAAADIAEKEIPSVVVATAGFPSLPPSVVAAEEPGITAATSVGSSIAVVLPERPEGVSPDRARRIAAARRNLQRVASLTAVVRARPTAAPKAKAKAPKVAKKAAAQAKPQQAKSPPAAKPATAPVQVALDDRAWFRRALNTNRY